MPLFQAGNSALTLTSLSISRPVHEQASDKPVPADEEEDQAGDFPVSPAGKPAETAKPKYKNQPAALDADARTKGVFAGLAGSAGIRPYYPLGARLRGEEGVVKVEVCVGSNGRVLDCAVVKSSGYATLDHAALKAVESTRFISAECRSLGNRSRTVLTFRFALVD